MGNEPTSRTAQAAWEEETNKKNGKEWQTEAMIQNIE